MTDFGAIEAYQSHVQSESQLALAVLNLCLRWYGRERVGAALDGRPDYSGLIELVQQIAAPDRGQVIAG